MGRVRLSCCIIARDEETHLGQFYASKRHTIQVDFATYVRDLMKEIAAGEKRARAAGARLPVEPRAASPVAMAAE